MLAKMSGIGCSSKTPAYFVETAHGFNGVHGRMPSLTTGAHLANRQLIMLGVSGDGDTASIGLGQFMHLIRRNVDCTYIIEDNGPTDRRAAIRVIEEGRAEGHLVTGLLYVDTAMADFASTELIPQRPLKDLGEDELRLSREDFAQFMSEFA